MASQDKKNLSSSAIKQQIMARAHSVNSDVIPGLTSMSEVMQTTPKTAKPSAPKPISNTPEEQKVTTINRNKKSLRVQQP